MNRNPRWRHFAAGALVSLVFIGQAALPIPDAIIFHSTPHTQGAHVESTGAPCHASHCLLGFAPAAAEPLVVPGPPAATAPIPASPERGLPNVRPARPSANAATRSRAPPPHGR